MRGNVIEHKVPGYAIVNVSLKAPGRVPGDITADKMDAVADLADTYSFGEIRVSHRQNLVLVDVKQSDLQQLWRELYALELATPNLGLLSDIICCPGLDYCALANARSIPIAQDISHAFTDLDELQKIGNFTINISGCMNACGHHHVGHIGILGVDKRGEEFFQLTLGGSSDQNASLGDRLGPGLPQAEVPGAIRKIVDTYLEMRAHDERFIDTYRRVGIEPFKARVYGEASPGALMSLIKAGKVVADTVRRRERCGGDPARRVPVIVSLEQWQAQRDALIARGTPLGIRLRSDQSAELIADDVARFALVALEFPKFRDGRAYSYARLLRERYGFKGELRAVGDVLMEQIFFMLRTGFDAFDLQQSPDPVAAFQTAMSDFSVWYQPTADGRETAVQLRHRRH